MTGTLAHVVVWLVAAPVGALLARVTLVLLIGALVAAAARGATPALRSAVWVATLAAALVAPVLFLVTPAWRVAVLPASTTNGAYVPAAPVQTHDVGMRVPAAPLVHASTGRPAQLGDASVAMNTPGHSADRTALHPGSWLLLLWLAGLLLGLARIAAGSLALRRISRVAKPLDTAEWRDALARECASAGVATSVALRQSAAVSTPLTWGIREPVILLPEESTRWPESLRRAVLRHELAHIARHDLLAQLVAGVACAMYWFHPLLWVAARRLRAERERACDDRVIASGMPAAEYAASLLDIARSARALGAPALVSVAMARPSQLEGRLLAVLNAPHRRADLSPRARALGVGTAAVMLLAISAFRPVPRASNVAARTPTVTRVSRVFATQGVTTAVSRSDIDVAARDSVFDRTLPAQSGGTLVLDLVTGATVSITAWDRDEVQVHGTLAGPDWPHTRVTLESIPSGVRLTTRDTARRSSENSSHSFQIRVPRRFDVRIHSAGGAITLDGLTGAFTGVTGGGEIIIRHVNGSAMLSTGGGDIHVSDSNLSGAVTTGGGAVRIQRVRGGLRGSSGSGDVTYSGSNVVLDDANGRPLLRVASMRSSDADGPVDTSIDTGVVIASDGTVRANRSGGEIDVPRAPHGARLVTGGGPIHVGPSAGDVFAQTGGGDVDIGPLDGSASVITGAGNVSVTIHGSGSHSIDIASGNGRAELTLPADLSARFDLETAYTNNLGHATHIQSDWPLQVTETQQWDDSNGTPRRFVRARGAVGGGGGLIRVRVVNGDIVVRRR